MKLPPELEDEYVKEVLYNHSLENLPNEKWKNIEDFENYAISNYGRVKSLERTTFSLFGKERLLPDMIMKLSVKKQFNKYLQTNIYNVHCSLMCEDRKYTRSVARLVYYHFIEKFDKNDTNIRINFKDNNRFNLHSSNLEKISVRESRLNTFRQNRARNVHVDYLQAVSQYTAEGDFISNFESVYAAEKKLGITCESIMDVINSKFLTAGTFRWFLQNIPPNRSNLLIAESKDSDTKVFNSSLWVKLGKPSIDHNNPPPCMNLSIKDLSEEYWVPIPILGFEKRFVISNRGRIKRLGSWTSKGRKILLKEQILAQMVLSSTETTYSLYCVLKNEGQVIKPVVSRLLYYCFVQNFDLRDRRLVIVNDNIPLWNIDISKLSLRPINYILKERYKDSIIPKVRKVFNTKKVFNDILWKKLGQPPIDEKNPLAIFNLSLKNMPGESWKALPGLHGKYVISNRGRVKRLSGWGAGFRFYKEEQVLHLNLHKSDNYLYFRVHPKEDVNTKSLARMLYYCFVKEFDLQDRTLRVVNQNKHIWDIDLSKLSLRSILDAFNRPSN
ncbi:hypothetical protein D1631_18305 [Chryseobacterium nematophagum]|uniref:NUMOD4 domain-containing protein n=1 Tax=Chryseobacterium nematophagum TaxID=2305228 RepID=A0A3M7TE45_9FLAO|nr:NUMOD4 domain-containing protein [Chryseobacterium nematophagum]RNA60450.1 hypothetical protein D1631_18305 [Chryseobacterium nematophagum]